MDSFFGSGMYNDSPELGTADPSTLQKLLPLMSTGQSKMGSTLNTFGKMADTQGWNKFGGMLGDAGGVANDLSSGTNLASSMVDGGLMKSLKKLGGLFL